MDAKSEAYIISLLKEGFKTDRTLKKVRETSKGKEGTQTQIYYTTSRDIRNNLDSARIHNVDVESAAIRVRESNPDDGIKLYTPPVNETGESKEAAMHIPHNTIHWTKDEKDVSEPPRANTKLKYASLLTFLRENGICYPDTNMLDKNRDLLQRIEATYAAVLGNLLCPAKGPRDGIQDHLTGVATDTEEILSKSTLAKSIECGSAAKKQRLASRPELPLLWAPPTETPLSRLLIGFTSMLRSRELIDFLPFTQGRGACTRVDY
ncbi:hypothetical protein RB195_025235 [Necator americanus]|uniref:Uncharacterized protein n=1 Tax=Necator americanus TaxID=51031 RepID=A0ABR1ERE4_NECAM